MVYIDRSGQVLERRPWDLRRVFEIFVALWILINQFFRTLFAPFTSESPRDSRNNNRRDGWGGGGGGGGGGYGGGGGGGGGLRPNRRIGRITNTMDCNTPMGG